MLLHKSERVQAATLGTGGTTYVFMTIGAGQVERGVAIIILHLGAGLVV